MSSDYGEYERALLAARRLAEALTNDEMYCLRWARDLKGSYNEKSGLFLGKYELEALGLDGWRSLESRRLVSVSLKGYDVRIKRTSTGDDVVRIFEAKRTLRLYGYEISVPVKEASADVE